MRNRKKLSPQRLDPSTTKATVPEMQQVKQATSPVYEIIKTQEPKIETPKKPKEPKQNFNHQQGLVSKNLM